jgi:hypothetical protein
MFVIVDCEAFAFFDSQAFHVCSAMLRVILVSFIVSSHPVVIRAISRFSACDCALATTAFHVFLYCHMLFPTMIPGLQ